tara:strand:+ start:2730 stop:2855 length:126 start_codon:yes stop_codon:yes gene_type:complete
MNKDVCPKCGKENCKCDPETCGCEPINNKERKNAPVGDPVE